MIDNLEWVDDVLSGGCHALIKGTNERYWIMPHRASFYEWTWEIFVGAALQYELSGTGRNLGWRQDNRLAPLRRHGRGESSAKAVRRSEGVSVRVGDRTRHAPDISPVHTGHVPINAPTEGGLPSLPYFFAPR